MTVDSLLETSRHFHDCWIIYHGKCPETLRVESFTDVGSAAGRYFALNQAFTPVVDVFRVSNGDAVQVGHARHGVGAFDVL